MVVEGGYWNKYCPKQVDMIDSETMEGAEDDDLI